MSITLAIQRNGDISSQQEYITKASIAQGTEQRVSTPQAVGSNPTRGNGEILCGENYIN